MDTSVSRRIDELGRIVIPKHIRKTLKLKSGEALDIIEDNEKIIIQKSIPKCVHCEGTENLYGFTNNMICGDCIKKIAEMAKCQN